MDFIELKKISQLLDISTEDCRKTTLDYSNYNGVKLLHSIDGEIIVPKKLNDAINDIINSINSSLKEYKYILSNKSKTIPFSADAYVYSFNEEFYIYRDKPNVNLSVMTPQEYFKKILSMIDVDGLIN